MSNTYSDHTIMADLLMISSKVDEIIEEYELNIPPLNSTNVSYYLKQMTNRHMPNDVYDTLVEHAIAYAKLHGILGNYTT